MSTKPKSDEEFQADLAEQWSECEAALESWLNKYDLPHPRDPRAARLRAIMAEMLKDGPDLTEN